MVTAFVLINVQRQKLNKVIQDILGIDGITEVYTVAGEYDLVAITRVKDNKELARIIADKMPHHIDGITHTKTLIALDAFSDFKLEEIFLKT